MTAFENVLAPYLTVQEIANDGSDIADNPPADYRRLFVGEDGQLHLMDSFGTVTDIGGGSFDPDNHLPWRIDVNPILGASVNTGFSLNHGAANIGEDEWADHGMVSTAQNDELGCDVILAAGTWSAFLLFYRNTTQGIATVSLDGSSVGTIDSYGSSQPNTVGSITGITVGSSGKKAFKLKMATKNGSSSGYALWLSWIVLVRTA